MLNEKYVINHYTLEKWEKVERHLEKMAAKGWRLESTGTLFWKYRRAEPAKIHYAVTCLPHLFDDTPRPDRGEVRLDALCEAGGWKRVAEWGGMLIYENSDADPVPVETDETMRLDAVYATVSKRQLGEFFTLLMPLFIWWEYHSVPAPVMEYLISKLTFGEKYAMLLCWIVFFQLPIGGWLSIRLWRVYAGYRVRHGKKCPQNHLRDLNISVSAMLLLASVVLYVSDMGSMNEILNFGGYAIFYMGGIFFIQFIIKHVRIHLREEGREKWETRGIGLAVTVVLSILLAVIVNMLF